MRRLIAITVCCLASCSSSPVLNQAMPVWGKGVKNLYRVTPNVYTGAQPTAPEGFASLRELGVRTIISVDGARPNIGAALHNGMRYVHVPVGYDTIERDEQLRIIQAAKTMPGPVFVHCHHGIHRAPTAAALVVIALDDWSTAHATAFMRRAGTSAQYTGLYKTVNDFDAPSGRELKTAGELPELVEPDTLIEAMLDIDDRWSRLKAARRTIVTAGVDDALLLREHFRELARTDEAKRMPEGFLKYLEDAEQAGATLESALRSKSPRIDDAFTAVGRSCTACHQKYRN